jgi:AcrR family transcriptional regulator
VIKRNSELKNEVIAFKKKRILEEAAHLFFQHGYEGTTLDAIAQQLQVTKPYLYSYFQNKGEILFDICKAGIQHSLEALDEALALDGSPTSRLKVAVERVARIVIDQREYVAVYQREEKNLGFDESKLIKAMRKQFDRRISNLLREGMKRGEFVVDDPSVAATTIGGVLSWLPTWYRPEGSLSSSEVIAYTVRLVLRMVQRENLKAE